MRVLVTVCGIGLGHATRIVAILNELKKRGKVKVVASGLAQKYLSEAGYQTKQIKSVDFESESFTFNTFSTLVDNMDLPMNFTRNYFTLSEIIDDFEPDVLLCDSEPTSFVISKMKRVKLAVLTNLFSSMEEARGIPKHLLSKNSSSQMIIINKLLNTVMKYSNVIINPSFTERTSLSEKLKFIGLIIRDRPEDMKSENLLRKKVGEDFYLVSFGGSSFGNSLFDQLSELLTEFSDKNFVVSSGFRAKSIRKYKNLTVFPFIDNYLEYLRMCRGLISTAGYSTLSEAFVYRKPSMIIPIHDHIEQMGNAHLFDKMEIANACFLKGPNDVDALKKGLTKFFSNEEKYRKNIEGMKVNSNGAKEVVDILSSL